MNSVRFFLLVITTFLLLSCFEDADDNGAFASEINDFVWKGMNAAYLYKEEINDLSNNRFSDSQDYATYLNSYEYPEELYEWEDFMRYFPIMQGNYTMHPMFWKLYVYQNESHENIN